MDAPPGSAGAPRRARLIRPLQEFLQTEAAGGILLLAATLLALVWVNSRWSDSYDDLWGTYVTIDLHFVVLHLTLQTWVNDLLMALFFFVVGMEIKREVLRGELASVRRATLPVAAAAGGMIAPALLYITFNAGGDGQDGWGIPMATDIAFAVGVLSLMGPRVPLGLKVFLLALAIVDDLGAISVIALFYTDELHLAWLAAGGVSLALTFVAVQAGFRQLWLLALLGLATWLFVHESGVHATIAGVAMGLLMPLDPQIPPQQLAPESTTARNDDGANSASAHSDDNAGTTLAEQEGDTPDTRSLLDRLEHSLHPWTSFVIVPLFALANAGVGLSPEALRDAASSPVALGIAAGLMIGKPVGITLFAFLAVRLGIASLPENVDWWQVVGVSMIAGIGFTVSIFITGLAFDDGQMIDDAKIGILAASAAIGVIGFVFLSRVARSVENGGE